MKSDYPLCPFCKVDKTCERHVEKGAPKVKKMHAIPKVSAKKKIADKLNKPAKEALNEFFDNALAVAPFHCEECGDPLADSMGINARTIVAHLLPKRKEHGFPSVASHPDNKAYLCYRCHHDYDNKGSDYVTKMKLYPTILERVALLLPHLTPEELVRVPEHLITINNEPEL